MLIIFVRTLILYTIVVLTMRLMGKRQIGQLEPYELVIAILIAELAAVPMEDKSIPLINGIIPILTLLFIQVAFSFISLKSVAIRRILDGHPSVIMSNGKINEKEMYNARYNLDELMEQLRVQGYPNIGDIEFAILETNGDLSVVPKSQKRAVTPEDLQLDTAYEGISTPLIMDGHIVQESLRTLALSNAWLQNELKKKGIKSPKEVFFAIIDTQGRFYCQPKAKRGE